MYSGAERTQQSTGEGCSSIEHQNHNTTRVCRGREAPLHASVFRSVGMRRRGDISISTHASTVERAHTEQPGQPAVLRTHVTFQGYVHAVLCCRRVQHETTVPRATPTECAVACRSRRQTRQAPIASNPLGS